MVIGDDASKEYSDFLIGGAVFGIVFGILIVLLELSSLLGWGINIMALIVILFGTLVFAGAIYTLTRERR